MQKTIAVGGCHVISGKGNNLIENFSDVTVDKKIPYQLNYKNEKSLRVVENYLKSNISNDVNIVFQTGNIGFTNSIGNIIGFGTARKTMKKVLPIQLTDQEFLIRTSVDPNAKRTISYFLKRLLYVSIIPINFVIISFRYIPLLYKFKNLIKTYPNVKRVYVLTPFCAFTNFHWIFRRYGTLVYSRVFKNDKVFRVLKMYNVTNNENLFLDDKLHMNTEGYQALHTFLSPHINNPSAVA